MMFDLQYNYWKAIVCLAGVSQTLIMSDRRRYLLVLHKPFYCKLSHNMSHYYAPTLLYYSVNVL